MPVGESSHFPASQMIGMLAGMAWALVTEFARAARRAPSSHDRGKRDGLSCYRMSSHLLNRPAGIGSRRCGFAPYFHCCRPRKAALRRITQKRCDRRLHDPQSWVLHLLVPEAHQNARLGSTRRLDVEMIRLSGSTFCSMKIFLRASDGSVAGRRSGRLHGLRAPRPKSAPDSRGLPLAAMMNLRVGLVHSFGVANGLCRRSTFCSCPDQWR